MSLVARKALEKLLRSAENAAAKGVAVARAIQLQFSQASFPDYQDCDTWEAKKDCNSALRLAQREGAISITWDERAGEFEHIEFIRLVDGNALAAFLEVDARWDSVAAATEALTPLVGSYPVLHQVLDAWKRGVAVRSTKPDNESVQRWLDAVRVVDACTADKNLKSDIPIRSLSTTLFGDSKRIESLCALMDVLVQEQLGGLARHSEEVFQQLGLVRFPQTMLIAASSCAAVSVSLGESVVELVPPYLGLYPPAISRIQLSSGAMVLLTIENLTTFHASLTALHSQPDKKMLLIYTGGMPSPSWRRVYKLLVETLPAGSQVLHWGDVDAGGFRIAEVLASDCNQCGAMLDLHLMDVLPTVVRKPLSAAELRSIQAICEKREWSAELAAVLKHRSAVEQESLAVTL